MTRSDELFESHIDAIYRRTSKMFAVLMVVQWVAALLVALAISPYAWEGRTKTVNIHVWVALLLGGAISSLPLYFILRQPTAAVTRHVVAVGQMMWSALLIHLTGGRIETHFHVFVSLAFLAFYRDWKVLLPATFVVATDHLVRQLFWPESVYGMVSPEWWRFLEHELWVVFEDIVLIAACLVAVNEMREIARAQADLEAKSRALQGALDELAQSQGALVRAEKLAAVGQLAASVGHELRNPLAAARAANEFIAKKVKAQGSDPKVVRFTELVEHELDACGKIIGELLDFARERPLTLAPTPLRALVAEASALVPASKIEIVNRVAGDLPMLNLDHEQFRQVIINLVQNACEAMEARDSGQVTVSAERRGDGAWELTVEDDGPGMTEDTLAKIFEPLFTTKIKGTGLGLAIVASIVKRHGGAIRCDSRLGRGTRFVIDLPQPEEIAGARPRPPTPPTTEAHPK